MAFKENQIKIAQARKQLSKAEIDLYNAKIRVLKDLKTKDSQTFENQLKNEIKKVSIANDKLQAAFDLFHQQHAFNKVMGELEANIPVLMLPIRIETRFNTQGDNNELLVRVYPDDIHIHTHESTLTEQEYKHGMYYWKRLAIANKEGGKNKEANKQKAWADLIINAGIQRGLWIVKSTKPKNWTINFAKEERTLEFPKLFLKAHDWTRAPRTNVLPDRLALNILKNGALVSSHIGNVIPDTVFLGPDPFLAEEAFKKEDNSIILDKSFLWTTDFEEAVKKGLGFRIKLTDNHFNKDKIDQIVVMGVMASASADESKEMLEDLFENHHYSHKGFSFLPQESPTNNTPQSKSTYAKNEDYLPKGYYDGSSIQDLTAIPNAEGNNFAEYLGIDDKIFDEVNNAAMVEQFEASAINKVLYPATAGNFLEVLCSPAINKAGQKMVRDFFNHFVTAAGPMASIRIGDQPYGVLITSDLNKWVEKDPLINKMANVFKLLQNRFDTIVNQKVSHVGKKGDLAEIMLDILGLNAGSKSYSHRLGNMGGFWISVLKGLPKAHGFFNKQALIRSFFNSLGFKDNANPTIAGLSFHHKPNAISFNRLVDGTVPAMDQFLSPLGNTGKNYIEWLSSVKKITDLQKQNFGAKAPACILYPLMRHALLEELKKASENFYLEKNVSYQRAAFDKTYFNFDRKTNDITEWEILKGTPNKVSATKFNVSQPLGDHLLQAAGASLNSLRIKEMRAAMNVLAPLPTAKLHKYLRDHLDLVTYRLDAWQNGLFFKRVLENRAKQPKGLYIGAFGWVENLKMEVKTPVNVDEVLKPKDNKSVFKLKENAGFVQTPSLNHATAAGVLLSGYQNHATKSKPSPFAINLSSNRVRRAMQILNGIQQQQSLEALLGYQFERALHDITKNNSTNNLNQYIFELRAKFPIEAQSIPQAGTEAQEVISPFSVINGLNLTKAKSSIIKTIVSNASHANLILKEIDTLNDTMDALNDLMVAEATYQATQGKTDRTAGILNSLKYAEMPPELEVNKTPRSTQLGITNRVSIHFNRGNDIKPGVGWVNRNSPRSATEPGINEWLEKMIGDPRKIVVEVGVQNEDVVVNKQKIKLSELNLNAIDLVYLVGEDMDTAAKELDILFEEIYRKKVSDELTSFIKIAYQPEQVNITERPLIAVLPLLRNLRLMFGSSRPASAKDYLPKTKSMNKNPDELYRWDVEELSTRVLQQKSEMTNVLNNILNKPLNGQPSSINNPPEIETMINEYHRQGQSTGYLQNIELTKAAANHILKFLKKAYLFGVKINIPFTIDNSQPVQRKDLLVQLISAIETLRRKNAEAEKLIKKAEQQTLTKLKIEALINAGKQILGNDFIILPQFTFENKTDIKSSLKKAETNDLLKYMRGISNTDDELVIEEWLDSVGAVRKHIRFLNDSRLMSEAQTEHELSFKPVQLPFQEKDDWLAVEFPEIDKRTELPYEVKKDTICLAIEGAAAEKTEVAQTALILDEWTEFIPNKKEITGLTFNYNQPNASAPNTLLLAVEPSGVNKWSFDALLGTLTDTLRRAKSRAVEPNHLLADPVLDTMSPMTVASFDLNKVNVSLDYLVANPEFLKAMQEKAFPLYKDYEISNL